MLAIAVCCALGALLGTGIALVLRNTASPASVTQFVSSAKRLLSLALPPMPMADSTDPANEGLCPVVDRKIRPLKTRRARADVRLIRDAVLALLEDVPEMACGSDTGDGAERPGTPRVKLLVGQGDTPDLNVRMETIWTAPVDGRDVDRLENYLIRNRPGGDPSRALPGWRGAYLDCFTHHDPWGNRYMINIAYLSGPDGPPWDVVVLSAGPDEEVDSSFTQDGFVPGDDDIICLVAPGGVTRRGVEVTPPQWALKKKPAYRQSRIRTPLVRRRPRRAVQE